MKIFALEKLVKKQLKWGDIYTPFEICPLAVEKGQIALPVDQPTVTFFIVAPSGRPSPDPESNGSLAGRPPGRPELDSESRLSVRSTDPVDRGYFQRAELSGRSTDVHKRARQLWAGGRRPGRSTVQRALLSGNGPGRPDRKSALCIQLRSTGQRAVALWIWGRSTSGLNGQKCDRWPVDRKGNLALFSCQRADFQMAYKYPI